MLSGHKIYPVKKKKNVRIVKLCKRTEFEVKNSLIIVFDVRFIDSLTDLKYLCYYLKCQDVFSAFYFFFQNFLLVDYRL